MPDRIRIGLIGTSGWADELHLPAMSSHESGVMAAICGRDRQRAEALAEKYGVQSVYTDYQAMIDEGGLDAVIVATPEDLHHPMTMAALNAGKHVLCEKPMAFTASQSQEMLARAEDAGVKHMIQFTNRACRTTASSTGFSMTGTSASLTTPTSTGPQDGSQPRRSTTTTGPTSPTSRLRRGTNGERERLRLCALGLRLRCPRSGARGFPEYRQRRPSPHRPGRHHQRQRRHPRNSGDPWTSPPISEIRGLRRGASSVETLVIPDAYFGGTDPNHAFGVFQEQSIGPRRFIDAIVQNLPLNPDFYDGHQVQRIVEAAIESHLTGTAQLL